MPLSKAHKAETRARIVTEAGRLFRRHGFHATGIDAVMAAAGLTRGAFYAHFASKEALFAEVLRDDHGLLRMLRQRTGGADAGELRAALAILADYLTPAHRGEVVAGCTMAALTGEAIRADRKARRGFAGAQRAIAAELARGMAEARPLDPRALVALALAVGAVTLARAGDDDAMADAMLAAARAEIEDVLTRPRPLVRRRAGARPLPPVNSS